MHGDSRHNAVAVLPVGGSMNPRHPSKAAFYDAGQTAYVMFKQNEARTRPTRVLTSYGPPDGWSVGTILHLEHDQTNAYLGEYKIVGVHHFASGEKAGDVPDALIKHAVLK